MNAASAQPHTEAHAWFARLRAPDCSPQDRAAFEQWRNADPRHHAAYANLEDVWDLSAELAHEDLAIAAAARDARHQDHRPWLNKHRWPLVALAACTVLAVGLWLQLTVQQAPPAQHYATTPGEQRSLTLEDGTRVVLDTATAIEVRYGASARHLTLQQGRADFQVHKDPQRPFTVQAGPAQVTATGTQFQVQLEDGLGQVTLLEGQVRVAANTATPITLAPGQRISIDAAGLLGNAEPLSDTELAHAQGWTVGQLVVKEWPLEALVAETNRYGQTPLRLADASLRRLPVSGTFKPTEPDSVALALEYGWPVRVERRNDEIVLHRKE